MTNPVPVDFETRPIERRPAYPPEPVGVGIGETYYSMADGARVLASLYMSGDDMVMHNSKFDCEVAESLGLSEPLGQVHDTMPLLFLDDPYRNSLALKNAAASVLDMQPTEQANAAAWLISNQPVDGEKITRANFGKWLSYCPHDILAPYAEGDLLRTKLIFERLYRDVCDKRGMRKAYNLELDMIKVCLHMGKAGVRIDEAETAALHNVLTANIAEASKIIRDKLGEINIDSHDEVADALIGGGYADKLPTTAGGKASTTADAIDGAVKDVTLKEALLTYAKNSKLLSTYIAPWHDSGGRLYVDWSSVRGAFAHADAGGAKTGRLSSSPNLQNIPPEIRRLLLPELGHVFIARDYSQQEPRILAHFIEGDIARKYREDPRTDFHEFARAALETEGVAGADRKTVKIINLALMYGMGVKKLAAQLSRPVDEVALIRKKILALYSGLDALYKDMDYRSRTNRTFRTWGGREYKCEVMADGTLMSYKMVNSLIQGSAADCTKTAVVEYYKIKSKEAQIKMLIHDEIIVSVPIEQKDIEMEKLRSCMEGVKFDVPMLSDGHFGKTFGECK